MRNMKHITGAGGATHLLAVIGGLVAGAALMYLMDPSRGRRRRAYLSQKSHRYAREAGEFARREATHGWNKAQGVAAEMRGRWSEDHDLTERQLRERVRSAMGRAVSDASKITVTARDGVVVLSGTAPQDEIDSLVCTVEKVRGVREVVNQLEIATEAQDVSGMQRS